MRVLKRNGTFIINKRGDGSFDKAGKNLFERGYLAVSKKLFL